MLLVFTLGHEDTIVGRSVGVHGISWLVFSHPDIYTQLYKHDY